MMGHNNAIRNDDGIIENQLWKVRKDEEGNDRIVAGIKVIYNDSTKRVVNCFQISIFAR